MCLSPAGRGPEKAEITQFLLGLYIFLCDSQSQRLYDISYADSILKIVMAINIMNIFLFQQSISEEATMDSMLQRTLFF